MTNLTIANKKIRVKDGLYNLNDLHKASGSDASNAPAQWLRNKKTKEFLETMQIRTVSSEGRNGGTYTEKKAVYAYAMWISPEFQSHVIDAYDSLVTGQMKELERQQSKANARLENKEMTFAVKHDKERQGKQVAHYHFTNENNLINKITLGMTAAKYRQEHELNKSDSIRDTLSLAEIKCIEHLQRANTTMIELGMEYETRKNKLNRLYMEFHAKNLMQEFEAIEA